MASRITMAQQILKDTGYYTGLLDGQPNSMYLQALKKYQGVNALWSVERQTVGCIQSRCKQLGFSPGEIDGYWGPDTENALKKYLYFLEHNQAPPTWRPEDKAPVNPNNWPKAYTTEFVNFYGPEGESNLIKLDFPYEMRLAWDLNAKVRSTRCHKKVAESASRVLKKVLNHYGENEIKRLRLDLFGGCFNQRPIRGGSKPSMHSWGIAFDFDPGRNKLEWGRDKASFSQPDYDAWWSFWEEEGWVSLGRERNFDWMHVQAAKI